jgi:hypothetical protein
MESNEKMDVGNKISILLGKALYSPSREEVVEAIAEAIDTDNIDLLAACAHGLGHLARRFKYRDIQLEDSIRRTHSQLNKPDFLTGALLDMDDDINHFIEND